ncbi:biopolymer transport protein ExbD [Marinobacter gudaonensis]|uniref:Biopolymer transport protein ExbD n=1 Tax=Marinobacter gudaonensis TaxID=375760 RepID=A0A1I6H4G2_9GAMM|nr:biopolymer transporter ExbD [Marinobacter gudaonensis]SFR49313.1 biopolymer transport protein ExbD [Marinobacter gudaonensis]
MQLVEPRPSRPIPIRITPLIDVVFILLVFFMLTTRLLPVDYLELANDTASRTSATGEPLPELTVIASGEVRWREQSFTLDRLVKSLTSAGIGEVNLATTNNTPLGTFTRTLSVLNDGGIETHWQRTRPPTP